MKIIHICLACFYVEGMGYQENILPKIHSNMGNDVVVITSDYAFDKSGKECKKINKRYTNKYNVRVMVLERDIGHGIFSKFGLFQNLYNILEKELPDIIFVHGGQFLSLKDVVKYAQKYTVRLYLDQHADYYNAPINTVKKFIVHKIIYKYWIKKFSILAQGIYGVTPWRCRYLQEVYGVNPQKIKLLVMGGDDENIHFKKMPQLRNDIRQQINISENDFVVVTGGKIDKTKNIHLLIQAVSEINNENIKLIVFGQPNDEMKETINAYVENPNIRYLGWIQAETTYDYFLSSDLAVFPGTHSVLWEQACACGIPCVFKEWEGMHHVDVGGNCLFLYEDSVSEIKQIILDLYNNKDMYNAMKKVAVEKGIKTFSYKDIAKRAIELK